MAYINPPNTIIAGTGLSQTPAPGVGNVGSMGVTFDSDIASSSSLGVVQIGSGINVTPSGVISVSGPFIFPGYYGSFYDTTTQTNPIINEVNRMQLNTTAEANGISIVGGSRITFANAGVYNIQFSAQFSKLSGNERDADIWLAVNGNNLPWSNTQITLFGSNSKSAPAWNFVLSLAAGDYVELLWSSVENSMLILAQPAQIAPVRPEIPSVIVTATLVKAL